MDDLRVLVFFYIFESAMVGFVGFALIGFRMNLRQIILVGLGQGTIVYLVRGLYKMNEIPLGTHTFFNLLGLILILYLVTRKGFGSCITGSLLGFIIVILSESLTLPILYTFLNTTVESVLSDTWSHITMGYVGDWLLLLTTILLAITRKSLISVQENL